MLVLDVPGRPEAREQKEGPEAQERSARRQMFSALKEADERYRHKLMDEEERLLLAERIVRLKT